MTKPILNIADAELMDFGSSGGKFKAKLGRMGPAIGAQKLGAMVTIVEPGKRAFPHHVHHAIEEMFYIIEGEGDYRFGEETYKIKAGDLLAAPCGGPESAHQIINTGEDILKYLAVSTMADPDVVEYPDSGKFLVNSQLPSDGSFPARFRFIGRAEKSADYFEGEE